MQEFQLLIDGTEKRIAKNYAHQGKTTRTMLAHADYSQIYASMAVAAKREGLVEKAEEYREKSGNHKASHAKMLKADMARHEKKANNPLTPHPANTLSLPVIIFPPPPQWVVASPSRVNGMPFTNTVPLPAAAFHVLASQQTA